MRISIAQADEAAQTEFLKIGKSIESVTHDVIPAGAWTITGRSHEKPATEKGELPNWIVIQATSPDGHLWNRHFNEKDRTFGGWVRDDAQVDRKASIDAESVVYGAGVKLGSHTEVFGSLVGPYTQTKGKVSIVDSRVWGDAFPGYGIMGQNNVSLLVDSDLSRATVFAGKIKNGQVLNGAIVNRSAVDHGTVSDPGTSLFKESTVRKGGRLTGGAMAANNSLIEENSVVNGHGTALSHVTVKGQSRVLAGIHNQGLIKGGVTIDKESIARQLAIAVDYIRVYDVPPVKPLQQDRIEQK